MKFPLFGNEAVKWLEEVFGFKPKPKQMTLQEFASKVAKAEGKKSQTSIGNIREILKVINTLTGGELYKLIRKL